LTPSVTGDTVNHFRLSHRKSTKSRLLSPARDYVEGMWLMLQQPAPEDFVLATGETHPVREFVEKSFATLGVQIRSVLLPFNPFYLMRPTLLVDGKERG
jgi:hypothetical protein